MTNHYRTLGVDSLADAATIRSAYLTLIRRYHPDGGQEADAARAQAVTAAWEVLRDPARRAAYDDASRARFQPGGVVAMAPTSARGGAAARNLFLLLTAATVGLGWWATQQPLLTPPSSLAPTAIPEGDQPLPTPPIGPIALEEEMPQMQQADPPARVELPREREVDLAAATPLPAPTVPASKGPEPAAAQSRPRADLPRAAELGRRPAVAPAAAEPAIDLAELERHLRLFTDQSFRFGTEAKRVRLLATGETFAARLRECGTDSCRRDTYLRRNVEVADIMRK